MGKTLPHGGQIRDATIGRSDLNTATAGEAVAAKIVAGNRVAIQAFTGADSGTGDVTVDLKEHYYSALFTQTGTTVTWTNGNVQARSLSAPITFTFAGAVAGGRYALVITNSGGAQTITWPAAVKWSGGTVPTPSASGKVDIYTFLYDGTNYYGAASLNY